MNEQFLAAVIASPYDDTPRLIYADWLDDEGDAARAEFIRTQIEDHRQPNPTLAARCQELLGSHKHAWEIPGIKGVQRFRRGFVERIETAAADFLAHAERIGASAPVIDLRLPLVLEHLDALATVPWLSRIESLDLTGNVGITGLLGEVVQAFQQSDAPSLPARVVNTLFDSGVLGRLRNLVLRNNQFWPGDVASLARIAGTLPKLERLNLSGNPIGDGGVETLARDPAFANLRELILRCDELPYIDAIHDAGAEALAASQTLWQVVHLDLSGHYIGNRGFHAIMTGEFQPFMETLNVSYNEIELADYEVTRQHFCVLRPRRLSRLILDGNRIREPGLRALLKWGRLENMESVSIRECLADDTLVQMVKESPHAGKFVLDTNGIATFHAEAT